MFLHEKAAASDFFFFLRGESKDAVNMYSVMSEEEVHNMQSSGSLRASLH